MENIQNLKTIRHTKNKSSTFFNKRKASLSPKKNNNHDDSHSNKYRTKLSNQNSPEKMENSKILMSSPNKKKKISSLLKRSHEKNTKSKFCLFKKI